MWLVDRFIMVRTAGPMTGRTFLKSLEGKISSWQEDWHSEVAAETAWGNGQIGPSTFKRRQDESNAMDDGTMLDLILLMFVDRKNDKYISPSSVELADMAAGGRLHNL